jgi:HK97 family phage prohead protease
MKIKITKLKTKIDGEEKILTIKGLRSNIKALPDDPAGEGIIEAYVSIFGNVDSYGDIVEQGAFKDSLSKWFPRYPKGIWAHDWSLPIAKTLECREDARGLYVKAQLILTVEKGAEAWELIKSGVVTDFSFGYEVTDYEFDTLGFRHLKGITIYEWSPVLVGANNQATILSAKSAKGEGEEVLEEEVDVPENTPALGEEKPVGDLTPIPAKLPEEVPPAPEPVEEKAGRVLSSKNVELIKSAISSIDSAISGLTDTKSAFEALISAVEDTNTDAGKGKKEVDQPSNKEEIKNILKGVRQADKTIEKTIIRLKKMAE